ncbi:hypothetical protein BD410DRAFT_829528 [Rickenella mellea]|uniref:F-box domain-containing protein n=1 Tax=Rickenella mellea TaxID=50990 RepID=A0A4Y7PZZ9_9AGAM|nr:hypothetical protein BD410DRAFT_829528 [Rickenella mellea]
MDAGCATTDSRHDLLVHHSGPCHINKLPYDALSHVFLASLTSSVSRPNIRSSPVVLGRICRSWRKLSLEMPLLWNRIVGMAIIPPHLQDEASMTAELEKDILAFDEYLARSQRSPLDIFMLYVTPGVDTPPPYFVTKVSAIVLKILPHSQQWRNIILNIPDESAQTIFSQLASGVPRLTSLMVSEPNIIHQRPTLQINLSSAHQLECLHILVPTEINWSITVMHQMRELDVKPTSVSSFLQCIDQCPSLTSVEFRGDVRTMSEPLTEFHIRRLSSLVKIRLDELDQNLFSGLLDSLHLPVLKQLDLRVTGGVSDSSSFLRFLTQSQPPLKILSIIVPGMRTAELIHFLRHIPLLTVLRTDMAYFSDDIIQQFLIPSSIHAGSVLCPNLMSLWLLGKTEGACHSAAKVVVHRWHNASERIARIRQVWVSGWEWLSFLHCDGIIKCSEEGLQLSRSASWINYCEIMKFLPFSILIPLITGKTGQFETELPS